MRPLLIRQHNTQDFDLSVREVLPESNRKPTANRYPQQAAIGIMFLHFHPMRWSLKQFCKTVSQNSALTCPQAGKEVVNLQIDQEPVLHSFSVSSNSFNFWSSCSKVSQCEGSVSSIFAAMARRYSSVTFKEMRKPISFRRSAGSNAAASCISMSKLMPRFNHRLAPRAIPAFASHSNS